MDNADILLVNAARQANPDALSKLLQRYHPYVRRYAKRHCLTGDVDDAIQESLIILASNVSAIRVVAALSSWLFKVVQRECQRLGRKVFRLTSLDEQKFELLLASQDEPALQQELQQALESLPSHYREMILLRDFYELSISEIAEQTGLTVAASKSRLHRARSLVREYLLSDSQ